MPKKGLKRNMLIAAVIPAMITFVIILITSYVVVSISISRTVKKELEDMSIIVSNTFESEYPGDLKKVGDTQIAIYKGDSLLNDNYDFIDAFTKDTSLEITLFYGDLRVITTIKDTDGLRITGTAAPTRVVNEVLEKNKARYYDNVKLGKTSYYCYYKPITNSDGSCVGMLAICKPAHSINTSIIIMLLPLMLVCIFGMILVAVISRKTNSIISIISKLQSLFKNVAGGKLAGSIDEKILKREDELGDMAHSIVTMQMSLRQMVELDALTQINNRRFGENKLNEIIEKSKLTGQGFNVAIGDIDFFKKVNDTFGHDSGDAVLIMVAATLKKAMSGKGFVARWGGEEFLLVFDKTDYDNSIKALEDALNIIRETEVETKDGKHIKVTMSFGITEGNTEEETRVLLKRADERLYMAKTSGRNRIISQ